jgi:sugar phosphate isomerase/epimerase
MRAGIGSWSFPWATGVPGYPSPAHPLRPLGLLELARELQAGVIQIADNLPLDGFGEDELTRLRHTAEEWDIEVEVGTRGVTPGHLLRYLRIARCLGARILRTLTHTADSRPDLVQVEAWIREVLPQFEDAGVSLALENYERHSCAGLARLVESLGSPHAGICLDTVNSLGALETPREAVALLGPHTINLHVKDFEIRRVDTMMGYLVTGCAAGEGRLDIPWLVGEIRQHGRDPNLILELWPPYAGSVEQTVAMEREWVARSVLFLKKYERRAATA